MPETAVIDIEGVIGTPEQVQFDDPGKRVATYSRFAGILAAIKELKSPEVLVNIRSTGGDVHDALLIYDALTSLDAAVTTRCYGYTASAATVIAQAASPGRREVSPNTLYLIHCSESFAEGNSRSLSVTKDLLDKTDGRIADIYASASGMPVEKFIALMNENSGKGRWLTADECLSAGLADKIVADRVSNNAGGNTDDLAILCRLFGLTAPPGFGASECGGPDGLDPGLGGRKVLSRVFRRLFRAEISPGVDAAERAPNDGTGNENDRDRFYGFKRTVGRLLGKSADLVFPHTAVFAGASTSGVTAGTTPEVGRHTFPVDKKVIFERITAQSDAYPTETKPVEDPSADDCRRTPNREAYELDAMSLRYR